MRIVYDDTMQLTACELIEEYVEAFNYRIKSIVRYDWGMERVQMDIVKKMLNGFLEDYSFEIGNTVTHAHGIGNNCMYPVYYHTENEIQHCANINLNRGMYGEGYVSVEDYNGKKIRGFFYEITRHGVTKKRF